MNHTKECITAPRSSQFLEKSVADPDLQLKGVGDAGRSSRPLNKEGGGGGLPKIFFRPFGPHFGLKIRWALAPLTPPLDPPLKIASKIHKLTKHVLKSDVVFPGSIVQGYKIAKNLHSLRKNVSESHTIHFHFFSQSSTRQVGLMATCPFKIWVARTKVQN